MSGASKLFAWCWMLFACFCLWNKRVYSLHPGFADVWGVDNLWDISWTCIPLKGQQWTCQFLNEIFNWKAEKYIEKLSCFAEDWRQRPMVPARRGSVLDAAASTRWAFIFFSLWVWVGGLVGGWWGWFFGYWRLAEAVADRRLRDLLFPMQGPAGCGLSFLLHPFFLSYFILTSHA